MCQSPYDYTQVPLFHIFNTYTQICSSQKDSLMTKNYLEFDLKLVFFSINKTYRFLKIYFISHYPLLIIPFFTVMEDNPRSQSLDLLSSSPPMLSISLKHVSSMVIYCFFSYQNLIQFM